MGVFAASVVEKERGQASLLNLISVIRENLWLNLFALRAHCGRDARDPINPHWAGRSRAVTQRSWLLVPIPLTDQPAVILFPDNHR